MFYILRALLVYSTRLAGAGRSGALVGGVERDVGAFAFGGVEREVGALVGGVEREVGALVGGAGRDVGALFGGGRPMARVAQHEHHVGSASLTRVLTAACNCRYLDFGASCWCRYCTLCRRRRSMTPFDW